VRYECVFCDLDGTLTDAAPGITNCIRHALKALQMPDVEPDDLRWTLGPPLQNSLPTLLGTSDPIVVQRAIDHYRERFSTVGWLENSVYEGVPEALAALKIAGVRIFLATSKPRVFAEAILDYFELGSYFEGVYGSELDGTRANKTLLLAHVLEQERLDPKSCLMIGDREHDVLGAKANRIDCLGVTYGYGTSEELIEAGAIDLVAAPSGWPLFVLSPTGTL
jgi:phosphoglycolate phosphatase